VHAALRSWCRRQEITLLKAQNNKLQSSYLKFSASDMIFAVTFPTNRQNHGHAQSDNHNTKKHNSDLTINNINDSKKLMFISCYNCLSGFLHSIHKFLLPSGKGGLDSVHKTTKIQSKKQYYTTTTTTTTSTAMENDAIAAI